MHALAARCFSFSWQLEYAGAEVSFTKSENIASSGHETTDTNPGLATTKDDYSLEDSPREIVPFA
jgi:hypothetical protein